MKTALVISGGGSKGAFAVGVVKWLTELGVAFDIIVGTSTGALLAPLIGSDKIELAESVYSNVATDQLISKNCWLLLPWRAALYDDIGLQRTIERLYTEEMHETLRLSDKVISVCTVSLNNGETCYWHPRDTDCATFRRALLASSNQPGLMPPVQIIKGQDYHVDGGVREIAPIAEAVAHGAKKVYAVILEPEELPTMPGEFNRIPKILLRTLDLMFAETRKNDVELAKANKHLDLTVIRPIQPLTSNSLEFVPEKMQAMMEYGYNRAKELVPYS